MSNPLDDIQKLLDSMYSRRGEMALFEGLLGSVSTALENIQGLMERAETREAAEPAYEGGSDDDAAIALAIVEGLRSIPAPQVTVNIPQQAAPIVNVTAPSVTITPSNSTSGWVLTVLETDANGRPRKLSFKPEN